MKKNLFIYAALCALVVTGCSKQDEAETLQPGQGEALNITINATRHEAPSTRTEYGEGTDKLIVKWKSDKTDKLGIFASSTNSNVKFGVKGDLSSDGKSADFSGTLTITEPNTETAVYGYYPRVENGSTSTAIPISLSNQTQIGITGEGSLTHLADKDYMAATPVVQTLSGGEYQLSLAFNPLLTILSFEITQEMTVNSIRLEAVGDNNIPFYTNGTVNIETTDKSFPIAPSGTATNAITLNVNNGQIATGSSGMFNMMIFPIELSDMPTQFKATVTTTDGKVYTQTKNAPTNGFVRGKRFIMELNNLTEELNAADVWAGTLPTADDTYTYSGGKGTPDDPYQIATANDLAQLAANVNGKFDTSNNFILTKNINLNEREWTPIGQSGAVFQGTFDGGGKVITGMKITALNSYVGLFGRVDTGGTIKNINVAGEINIQTGANSAIYAGGILGYCNGATLSGNLTNHVNITITNTDTGDFGSSTLYVGGVAGRIKSKEVTDATLVNDGILNINGYVAAVDVGGVIGTVEIGIQEGTTLINSGAVICVSNKDICCVGGLIGSSKEAVTFKGTNTGSVKGQISSGTSSVYSGGFIGYAAKAVKIESTRNTGTVTAENNSAETGANSYAGIRVGGSLSNLVGANKDADGNTGGTGVVTATATTGKSYVNGVIQ